MPAFLRLDADRDLLTIAFGKMGSTEFQDAKARAKSIPGRRWNPDLKVWEYPNDADTAMRLIQMLEPVADAAVQAMVRNHAAQVAENLVTRRAPDAVLELPWADRLRPYQRAGIAWLVDHPHAILADEQGTGKTVECIAAVAEYLLRYRSNDDDTISAQVGIRESRKGEGVSTPVSQFSERQGGERPMASCASGEGEGVVATTPSTNRSDHPEGEGKALSDVRGSVSARDDGPTSSRFSDEGISGVSVAAAPVSSGSDEGTTGPRRNREVRRSLSELSRIAESPRLVVCPASVRGVWRDELSKWTGEPVRILDARSTSKRRKQLAAALETPSVWVVVNWEAIRLLPELAKVEWLAVIGDEIHRAKNRKAQQTKALWKLRAPIQIGASGTPVMNSPDELWAVLKWLQPEAYTSFWAFYYSYVDAYETRYGRVMTGVKNADQLRFELSDKLTRVTKRDVLTDLPPKTRQTIPVELSPAQRRLYKAAEKDLLLDVQEAMADPEQRGAVAAAIEAGDLQRLTYLLPNGAARTTRLRQIVSTPALLGAEDNSAKLDTAVELIRDNPGKPFVVFSWFADTARILADRLRRGKPALRVGTIAGTDDPDPVKDAFQAGDLDIVVATIAKGGVGLTLTRADTAIFIDRDWTPAINEQAEDRLHRIGQVQPVSILVLESPDTVDTGRIGPKNRLKELIAAQVLGEVA